MPDVHLHAVGMTPFGRHETPFLGLVRDAHTKMVADQTDDGTPDLHPDHVLLASAFPEEYGDTANSAAAVADTLGLAGTPAARIETAPSSSLAAVATAEALIRSGLRKTVLVVAAETMTRLTTEEANRVLARMAPPEERAHGLTMAAQVALMTRAYMDRFQVDRETLAACPVKAHAHGAANPYAHFRKTITADEALASPLVADPLRLYDCAPLSDGAVCLLLSATPGPVRLMATGHATDRVALTHRNDDPGALLGFRATQRAATEAFARAGVTTEAVDLIETHDAFSLLEGMNLEDLGFFRKGDGVRAVATGATALDGPLPTNVGGGLKARGHPVGATGAAQLAELHWQLTGHPETRDRQVARPDGGPPTVGLAHNIGGLGNNVLVALLEART